MIDKLTLGSGWSLSCNDTDIQRHRLPRTISAAIPGCVHLDLMAARLIPDPYTDVNEITNDWIGRDLFGLSDPFISKTLPQLYEKTFDAAGRFAVMRCACSQATASISELSSCGGAPMNWPLMYSWKVLSTVARTVTDAAVLSEGVGTVLRKPTVPTAALAPALAVGQIHWLPVRF